MAIKCIDCVNEFVSNSVADSGEKDIADHKTVYVLGLIRNSFKLSPVNDLNKYTNFEKRTHSNIWWMQIHLLMRILTEHFENDYEGEVTDHQ